MLCNVNSLQKFEGPTHKQRRYMMLLLLLSVFVPHFMVCMSLIFLKHALPYSDLVEYVYVIIPSHMSIFYFKKLLKKIKLCLLTQGWHGCTKTHSNIHYCLSLKKRM
jgi:hypothetical protein